MRRLVVLGCLVVAAPAAAFELKTDEAGRSVRWPGDAAVRYVIDDAGARDLSPADTDRAVRRAFAAWSAVPGADLRFEAGGRASGLRVGYDPAAPERNQNAVIFSRDAWTYESDALALTLTLYRVGTGELVDADIIVNEAAYAWGEGGDAEHDLQNALTHEVGHFIGLAHSQVDGSTMYPEAQPHETEKRDLHDDDIAGVRSLYPGAPVADAPAAPEPEERPEPAPAARNGGAWRDDAVPAPPRSSREPGSMAPSLSCNAAAAGPAYGFWTVLVVLGALRRRREG